MEPSMQSTKQSHHQLTNISHGLRDWHHLEQLKCCHPAYLSLVWVSEPVVRAVHRRSLPSYDLVIPAERLTETYLAR
jgi:hypothetical protein